MPNDIQAQIQGHISGQVAVGNNINQSNTVNGDIVNQILPDQRPHIQPRPTPMFLRPHPFRGMLDRGAEIKTAAAALQSGQPVAICGPEGIGKTVVLHRLAYLPATPPEAQIVPLSDGVVCFSAHHEPLTDVLQRLWEAFYTCDIPVKMTEMEIHHALQDKQALILVDDVKLARNEAAALMDAAPACTFGLASPERCIWGEGEAIVLDGLSIQDGLVLIEREIGRRLSPDECTAAQALCRILNGNPLRLLQAAAMAREDHKSLVQVTRQLQRPEPATQLEIESISSVAPEARQVAAVLAAHGGGPVHADHLGGLAGLVDAGPALNTLERRRLVKAHSPSYSLTGTLAQTLSQSWDMSAWLERALRYWTEWAERQAQTPQRLLEEADALVQILEQAAKNGRWQDVLRLGRAMQSALALGARWGLWGQVLLRMLEAAQALTDRAAEAWALHQLGTRDLCLGNAAQARVTLTQALDIRQALGDQAGAAVTRHNLGLIAGPAVPPRRPPPTEPGPAIGAVGPSKALLALIAAGVVALGAFGAWFAANGFTITLPTPVPPVVIPSGTATSTPMPTLTATPTHTPTPTSTPQPPSLSLPQDITVEATGPKGAAVSFDAAATDPVDGNLPVTCQPASGSTFALGSTTVTCSARNHFGLTVSGTLQVEVRHMDPPKIGVPAPILVEAANRSGAKATYTVSASDVVDGAVPVKCDRTSGSTFPLGDTTISCTATDSGSNTGTGSFLVSVQHKAGPKVNVPKDMLVEATKASGANVTYPISAADAVDGAVPVTCDHPRGSTFGFGTTTVSCTAQDSAGNTGTGAFKVTVQDKTAPRWPALGPLILEATGPSGAVATFTASASDAVDGTVAGKCDRAPGSTFALGTTTVTCTATDKHNNTSRVSFQITVRDTTPPRVTVPRSMIVEALGPTGAPVTYPASASDVVDGGVPVTCDHAYGSIFAIGTTTVTCRATDKHGNIGTGSFPVTVRGDVTPPIIKGGAPSSSEICGGGDIYGPAALTINATVTDDSGVGAVVLRYRYVGSDATRKNSDWIEVPMSPKGSDYTRTINVRSDVKSLFGYWYGRLEYTIIATDTYGKRSQTSVRPVLVNWCIG